MGRIPNGVFGRLRFVANQEDAWFFYRLKGTTDEHRLDAFSFAGSMARGLFGRLVPTTNHFSGSGPEVGRLVAYPLEPGEYELYSWTLYVDRAGGYGYVSPKNRLSDDTLN